MRSTRRPGAGDESWRHRPHHETAWAERRCQRAACQSRLAYFDGVIVTGLASRFGGMVAALRREVTRDAVARWVRAAAVALSGMPPPQVSPPASAGRLGRPAPHLARRSPRRCALRPWMRVIYTEAAEGSRLALPAPPRTRSPFTGLFQRQLGVSLTVDEGRTLAHNGRAIALRDTRSAALRAQAVGRSEQPGCRRVVGARRSGFVISRASHSPSSFKASD